MIKKKHLGYYWPLYVMIIPGLIWYFLFYIKPFYGLSIAFKDYSPFIGIAESEWIGFSNFRELMFGATSYEFWRAVKNTIILNILGIVLFFPAPIVLALLFFEMKNERVRGIVQLILYLPYFISVVVISSLIIKFLSPSQGIINTLLVSLGLIDKPIHFLIKPQYYRTIYIISAIWQNAGYSSIIYFSALMAIPSSFYEAAIVDGASKFQKVIKISLPSILPTIVMMLIMKIGNILTLGHEKTLLLYTPQTYEVADILSTFIYRYGINGTNKQALVTAAGLFQSLIAVVLIVFANKLAKKISTYSLW